MRIIQFGSAMSTFGTKYAWLFAKYSDSNTQAVCKTGEHMSLETGIGGNYFSTFRLEFV
jgi:hypothetical protein